MATVSTSRDELPSIPAKRYFTIGEVSELCGVKPHVLRYWEQEFTQLRYYQHHEVLLVRRIRELLYQEGFTISGARNRLEDGPGKMGDAVELPMAATSANGSSVSVRAELAAIIELLRTA